MCACCFVLVFLVLRLHAEDVWLIHFATLNIGSVHREHLTFAIFRVTSFSFRSGRICTLLLPFRPTSKSLVLWSFELASNSNMFLLLTYPLYFCEVFAQRSRDEEVASYVLVKHEKLSLVVWAKAAYRCSSGLGRVSGTQQRNYM